MLKEKESAWNSEGLGHPSSATVIPPRAYEGGQPPRRPAWAPSALFLPWVWQRPRPFPLEFQAQRRPNTEVGMTAPACAERVLFQEPPSCGHRKGPSFEGPEARQAADPPKSGSTAPSDHHPHRPLSRGRKHSPLGTEVNIWEIAGHTVILCCWFCSFACSKFSDQFWKVWGTFLAVTWRCQNQAYCSFPPFSVFLSLLLIPLLHS